MRLNNRQVRTLLLLLSNLLLILLIGWVMSNIMVRWLIYPAPGDKVPSPPPAPLKEISFQLPDGTRITGWSYFGSPENPFLLYFHGNGDNLATMWEAGFFNNLFKMNVNFLALDYPGYGRSTGKPSQSENVESGRAAVEWISKTFSDPLLIVCGWSLGAAVAIQTAAANQNVSGLILLSGWSSLSSVAREHFPAWLVNFLLPEHYDSKRVAQKIHLPVLMMHGTSDTVISVTEGRQLARSFPNSVNWIEVPGTGHNDLLLYPSVWREIRDFIDLFRNKN